MTKRLLVIAAVSLGASALTTAPSAHLGGLPGVATARAATVDADSGLDDSAVGGLDASGLGGPVDDSGAVAADGPIDAGAPAPGPADTPADPAPVDAAPADAAPPADAPADTAPADPAPADPAPVDPAAPDELYLLSVKKTAGRPAMAVLADVLPALLRSLAFPKRMSWDAWLDDGKGAFPFGRPIRWLIALLGGEVVPFSIYALVNGARGGEVVRTGNATHGHRFFPRGRAGAPIRVDSFDDLRLKLRDHRVVLEARDRDAILQSQLSAGNVPETEVGARLLAEWRQLVEWPQVVFGTIPEEFRGLPAEVLETVLVHHQNAADSGDVASVGDRVWLSWSRHYSYLIDEPGPGSQPARSSS